jgi:FKBP-type peptidyl-prolyl cis-trans isomerase 2
MSHIKIWAPLAVMVLGLQSGMSLAAQPEAEDRVAQGKKVVIEFSIIMPESNEVIPHNVAQYVQGQQQVIPALEQALVGLKPGDTKRVELAPDQAFGPYDENKKTTISRQELPPNAKTGIVMQNREGRPFTVVEVSDQSAVVDYNHPLAGKRLVFDVKVLKVEDVS